MTKSPVSSSAPLAKDELSRVLGEGGELAQQIPGYTIRPAQQKMAASVASAIAEGACLFVEAGTGTGKTFAYLVPALLSGQKIIVSTGTKPLQDQLFDKDLPRIRDVLGLPVAVALLKGRSNYLCLHRLDMADTTSRQEHVFSGHQKQRLKTWSRQTHDGDLNIFGESEMSAYERAMITSTVENCLGQECPVYQDCFVVKARRKALAADIVVVNHHLLFADMVLKQDGFGELLPGADAVIMDEAHQVPDVATQFFGYSVSFRQLMDWSRDVRLNQTLVTGLIPGLDEACAELENSVRQLRQLLGTVKQRLAWPLPKEEAVYEVAHVISEAISEIKVCLEDSEHPFPGIITTQRRGQVLQERLLQFIEVVDDPGDMVDPEQTHSDEADIHAAYVRWVDVSGAGFTLQAAPLDISGPMSEHMAAHMGAWIFTSATLAVGKQFSHIVRQMGAESAHTLQLESPFDYPQNTRLYLPPNMPDPGSRDYDLAVLEAALPLISACQGGVFLLFTSHRALRSVAAMLVGKTSRPLLVQGELGRSQILQQFRDSGQAVLLGTSSFWEGVDVQGDALQLVIIDRLPFASPGDPLLQARADALKKAGRNPFREYQLPQAVIALKQGAGRLIRNESDRGVLMIADPRLTSRSYGRTFLASLPEMPIIRSEQQATSFLRDLTHTVMSPTA